jgi:hypothetical protein
MRIVMKRVRKSQLRKNQHNRGTNQLHISTVGLSHFFERIGDGAVQKTRTVSVQRKIDTFEAPDQIENVAARDWSTGGSAEVRATTEWSIFVDQTVAGLNLQHWARAIRIFRERFPTGSAKCFGRDDGFAFCQVRSAPGQFEVTTFRLAHAIALDRSLGKIAINLSHFRQRGLQFSGKKISSAHLVVGSTPAIACPAIQPVVQAA